MKKHDLINAIKSSANLNQHQTEEFLDAFVEHITDALARNDSVALIGFGSFSTRTRAAREARNPQSGAIIQVPESVQVVFKAGKQLKDSINPTRNA